MLREFGFPEPMSWRLPLRLREKAGLDALASLQVLILWDFQSARSAPTYHSQKVVAGGASGV